MAALTPHSWSAEARMTDPQVMHLIDQQTWRFAKTMPEWPHWYCLRKEAPDPDAFEALASHIVENGYLAEFRPDLREDRALHRELRFSGQSRVHRASRPCWSQ